MNEVFSKSTLKKYISLILSQTTSPKSGESNYYIYSIRAMHDHKPDEIVDSLEFIPRRYRLSAKIGWVTHEFLYSVDEDVAKRYISYLIDTYTKFELSYYRVMEGQLIHYREILNTL